MNNRSIPSTYAVKKITNLSDEHSFTLHPSLSPYSRTELGTEEQIHLLCVGWRNLFSSCAVVLCQFLVLVGNGLGLHTHVLRVQYRCGGVLVFWF